MNKTEIFEKVRKITIDCVGLDEEEVNLKSDFINDLGCDSLLLSELIMLFEDGFDLKIADKEVEHLRTIGSVVDFIDSQLNRKINN